MESQQLDHYLSYGTESFAESLTYFPDLGDYNIGPEEYLEHDPQGQGRRSSIPIIASLNGVSTGGWIDYAKKIEQAGADAPGAQHLLHPHRPRPSPAPRSSRCTSTSCAT